MSATASTATQPKPLEWLNRLRANPRIPLIVAGSAAVAIVVARRCDGAVGQNARLPHAI